MACIYSASSIVTSPSDSSASARDIASTSDSSRDSASTKELKLIEVFTSHLLLVHKVQIFFTSAIDSDQ